MTARASPDGLAAREGPHLLGRLLVACIPLGGEIRPQSREVVHAGNRSTPMATRAPSESSPSSARDDCLPDVTFRTPPLRATIRTRGHILRAKGVRFVPFASQLRVERGEICFAGHDAMTGAVRASLTGTRTGVDRCLPYVSVFALPGDLLARVGTDVLRAKLVAAVPLSGEVGTESCEISDAGQSALARAVRATRTVHTIGDRCLPAVTARTGPPDPSTSSGADRVWLEFAVSLVVPVCCEVGAHGGEIGLTWDGTVSGTVGAACSESCAISN